MHLQGQVERLASLIAMRQAVFFFGSGASKAANLPTGLEAVQWLFRALAQTGANLEKHIPAFCSASDIPRFELAISTVVDSLGPAGLRLMGVFDTANPTIAHNFVAKCATLGLVMRHITTNFDNILEKALDTLQSPYEMICKNRQFSDWGVSDAFEIFKLHGTTPKTEDDYPEVVATLDAVLRPLPSAKTRVLRHLLDSHHVVFVGYSAWDTDIYPILTDHAQPGKTWWVSPAPPNERIARILRDTDRNYIESTSDAVFSHLHQLMFHESPGVAEATPEEQLFRHLKTVCADFDNTACAKVIADLLSLVGLHDEAIHTIDCAKDAARDWWFFKKAAVLYQSGDWNTLKVHVSDNSKADRMPSSPYELSKLARIAHDAEMPEDAVRFAHAAFAAATRDNDPQAIATAGLALGNVLTFRGRHREALAPLETAKKYAANDPTRLASVQMSLGVLHYRRGDMASAEREYREALATITETTDFFSEAKCHLNLAELYRNTIATLHKALRHAGKALALARKHKFISVQANLFAIFILALRLKGDLSGASRIAAKAERFFATHENPGETWANTMIDIGIIHYDRHDYDKSLHYYRKAYEIYKEKIQYYRTALACSNIAQALIKLSLPHEAEDYIIEGMNFAELCGDIQERKEVTCWLYLAECSLALQVAHAERFKDAFDAGSALAESLQQDELIQEFAALWQAAARSPLASPGA